MVTRPRTTPQTPAEHSETSAEHEGDDPHMDEASGTDPDDTNETDTDEASSDEASSDEASADEDPVDDIGLLAGEAEDALVEQMEDLETTVREAVEEANAAETGSTYCDSAYAGLAAHGGPRRNPIPRRHPNDAASRNIPACVPTPLARSTRVSIADLRDGPPRTLHHRVTSDAARRPASPR